jgi:hypothetical protein
MGWLSVIVAVFAAILLYFFGEAWLFWLSVVNAILCFWSYGIMHNCAVEAAKKRAGYNGDFFDITEAEADAVPDWLAGLNLVASIVALILLIVGIYSWLTN